MRWEVYTKETEDLIKSEFSVAVPHPKGGGLFGLVWRIMLLGKRRSKKKFDYVALI